MNLTGQPLITALRSAGKIKKAIVQRIALAILCWLCCAGNLYASTDTLSFIGTVNKSKKTTKFVEVDRSGDTSDVTNITSSLDWHVKSINAKRIIAEAVTSSPDTLFKEADVDTVYLTSSFVVMPTLLNQVYALHFDVDGSVIVKLNNKEIIATGNFAPNDEQYLKMLNVDDFKDFVFKDSMQQKIEVIYVARKETKIYSLTLKVDQVKAAEESELSTIKDVNEDWGKGFYYLALGVVFIILFLFFRERKENLYFSLFCLAAALTYLWDSLETEALYHLDPFFGIFCFEFLSIFFYQVLKNKEKSKISLIVVVGLMLICLIPSIRYGSFSFMGTGEHFPVIAFIYLPLYIYTIASSFYYLIQGFGQKRWEAKTILVTCFIPIAMIVAAVFVLIIVAIVTSMQGKPSQHMLNSLTPLISYLSTLTVYIFPLGAVFILGKRNGIIQKQLVVQVESIKQLSEENLAREQEKKQILETQNTELERKVAERTTEVIRQKEVIEVKNKAITDNLNYAQRIQSAILPDINLIYKALAQSFILYLPKDIVSGDFYAFAEKNDRVLIMAGDCTGHGVSGAFMSMIGSSLLNQIINERGITEPAQILNQLNSAVIETFRQDESDSNDGMDISICSFDMAANTLEFAGANRPLWLVRNGEITILRPDKFPIGGLQMARDRTFTNHHLALQKGDTIYIFTDGYADQFGGERGKKMMTGKFKELLISIQSMPLREQGTFLNTHFENWKRNNEQVDDVLVIGIRI